MATRGSQQQISPDRFNVLCTKLDNLTTRLDELRDESRQFHVESRKLIQQHTVAIALIEEQYKTICKSIESQVNENEQLEQRLNRQDTINKIAGVATAILYGIAGLFGINNN